MAFCRNGGLPNSIKLSGAGRRAMLERHNLRVLLTGGEGREVLRAGQWRVGFFANIFISSRRCSQFSRSLAI